MEIEPPLDYRQTLDVLASWDGRRVLVISHSQAAGEPMSHTQVTVVGVLGGVQMVDDQIHPSVSGVAAFQVGHDSAFYLSAADFVHAVRLPRRDHLNVKFDHDFHIEVQLAP